MNNYFSFTDDEILATISALETFADSKNASVGGIQIREPLRSQLISSSINKLENISILTSFSKKEIGIIGQALFYILNLSNCFDVDEINSYDCSSDLAIITSALNKVVAVSDN